MNLNKEKIRKLYPIIFKVHQIEYYTLWYTDEIDGFLLDENKMIKMFLNETDVKIFAKQKGYNLDSEFLIISDNIYKKLDMQNLDCDLILIHWNILSDLARTICGNFLGDSKTKEIQKVYEKLFYGCNFQFMSKYAFLKLEYVHPLWNEKILLVLDPMIAQESIFMSVVKSYEKYLREKLVINWRGRCRKYDIIFI